MLAMGRAMGYVDPSASTTSSVPSASVAGKATSRVVASSVAGSSMTDSTMADSLSVSMGSSTKTGDDSTEISSIGGGSSTVASTSAMNATAPAATTAVTPTKKAAPAPFVPNPIEISGDNNKEGLGEASTVTGDDKEGVGFVLSPDPAGNGGAGSKVIKKEESNKLFQLSDSEDGSGLDISTSADMSTSGATGVSDSLSMPSKM